MIEVITLVLLSVIAGFVGALLGLGGGVIVIPVLVALGVPIKYAIAAAMVVIIATSSGSSAAYLRDRLINIRAAFFLEIFTVWGAILGASITAIIAPAFLYFFFALFLMASFIGFGRHFGSEFQTNFREDKVAAKLGLSGSYYDQSLGEEVKYKVIHPIWGGLGMFTAGIAAGMLGIGAGAFKVSVHELIMKMPNKVSTSTSNFIIGMTALAGSTVYFASGLLYVDLVAPMAVGATFGSVVGGRVRDRFSPRILRISFLVIVALLTFEMFHKGISAT